MGRKMNRGKQQVLFNYLPGRTFDFEGGIISRIIGISGQPNVDLNLRMILLRVREEARVWEEQNCRPALPDRVLEDPSRFILLEPKKVDAELFPKVLWCNPGCGRVFDYSNRDDLPRQSACPSCRTGRLIQLRFVKTHRCGALEPLLPPSCQRCHTSNNMALDLRGSERTSEFRWVCRQWEHVTL